LTLFWIISAIQLLLLAALQKQAEEDEVVSLVSIQDRMSSFDNIAVQQTFTYMSEGWKELKDGRGYIACSACGEADGGSSSGSDEEDSAKEDDADTSRRRQQWAQQRQAEVATSETAQLLV
jgi:hypothetical protein